MRKKIKDIEDTLERHKPILEEKYGVKEIGVFGSYVRGEEKEGSDVDILVDFYETISLFDFMELEEYLSELMGVKVDLVMKSALKPRIGRNIKKEVVYV
ncbi:MAG: nucleotidyltransferase family protein [Thermoplasmata archaeon]